MAEITPTSIANIGAGELALKTVNLTLATTGDTYTIEPNAPVIDYWCQGNVGTAGYKPDVLWTASTGAFTFTQTSQIGATTLFILMNT
jgi:hypothetical protein